MLVACQGWHAKAPAQLGHGVLVGTLANPHCEGMGMGGSAPRSFDHAELSMFANSFTGFRCPWPGSYHMARFVAQLDPDTFNRDMNFACFWDLYWAPHQGIPGVSSMSEMACEGTSPPQTGQSGEGLMSTLCSEQTRLQRGWS